MSLLERRYSARPADVTPASRNITSARIAVQDRDARSVKGATTLRFVHAMPGEEPVTLPLLHSQWCKGLLASLRLEVAIPRRPRTPCTRVPELLSYSRRHNYSCSTHALRPAALWPGPSWIVAVNGRTSLVASEMS